MAAAAAASGWRVWPRLRGLAALGLGAGLAAALAGYAPGDPSLNVAAPGPVANPLGAAGAVSADLLLQALGLAALVPVAILLAQGGRLLAGGAITRPRWRLLAGLAATLLAALALALGVAPELVAQLPAGPGGALGQGLAGAAGRALALLPTAPPLDPAAIAAGLAGLLALGMTLFAGGLRRGDLRVLAPARGAQPGDEAASSRPAASSAGAARGVAGGAAAAEPSRPARITAAAPRREQLPLPLDREGGAAVLPPLSLLATAPDPGAAEVDAHALQANARALEGVLADFGVDGSIDHVRAGPVVTLYELEPAPGIKASRVIGLADDIARSMSAVSARVAVVPGRTIIGIELPNAVRETVFLSELLASAPYQDPRLALPLVMGKDIAGAPVVVDLAPMPHLLIAGTTGSGKSVGLNAMILSLLYRLTPEQCRLILIDPKMLEFSAYDGIPHLLAPVVTEPARAIRALKWAVEQMEERYRMMAAVGVRSLSGFNQRVRDARADGRPLTRRVQTGFDPASGEPVFEEQSFDFEPLPLIVVVVDELADLMMTAGKEVEFLIQRLAQKARAAGIHLIMATQRPSVDVITGVIKANLPTRVSFQVTSKIDSRTILGEQGAEQLLGKGDMLYMPGGKQVSRVHGPFVSDEEVERVAAHWRRQGAPAYDPRVTEEPAEGALDDDGPLGLAFGGTAADNAADDYRRAVQVVAESQRASTSYIQRQLRIGYNAAARHIERMEKEGIVSPPDHVGRREVLVDRDGNRL